MKKFFALSILMKGYRFSLTPLLLPALPALALSLNVPTYQIKYLIAFISLGSVIGKICLILFGDRMNTKCLLLLSIPFAILGSLLGLYSNIATILLSGVCLSIGSGIGNTLVPKILKENNPHNYVTVSVGIANLIATFFPIIAMVGSGYIVQYLNWRGIYYIFLLFSIVLLWMILQAKLPKDAIKKSDKTQLIQLKSILENRQYLFLSLIFAVMVGISVMLSVIVPFLVINHLHETAQMYAFLNIPSYITSILGIYACLKLAPLISQRLFLLIFYLVILSTIIFMYFSTLYAVSTNLVIIISLSLYYFVLGSISNYVTAHAVVFFPSSMAAATSMVSLLVDFFSLIVGFIASHVNDTNLISLTYFMSILFVISVLFLIALQPSKKILIGSQEKGTS